MGKFKEMVMEEMNTGERKPVVTYCLDIMMRLRNSLSPNNPYTKKMYRFEDTHYTADGIRANIHDAEGNKYSVEIKIL